MRKEISIKVGVVVPSPAHEMMLSAVCAYYRLTEEQLFASKNDHEGARKRGILYYLTRLECGMNDTEIAAVFNANRQNVQKIITKIEYEVRREIYLQNSCDCTAIKKIFADLRIKQEEWVNQVLPSTNITHSTEQ